MTTYNFQPGQTYVDENDHEITITEVSTHEITVLREDGTAHPHHRPVFEAMAKRFHFRLVEAGDHIGRQPS